MYTRAHAVAILAQAALGTVVFLAVVLFSPAGAPEASRPDPRIGKERARQVQRLIAPQRRGRLIATGVLLVSPREPVKGTNVTTRPGTGPVEIHTVSPTVLWISTGCDPKQPPSHFRRACTPTAKP